ncbi:5881_t:CDS:1, partial [Ambispora leptoticha]
NISGVDMSPILVIKNHTPIGLIDRPIGNPDTDQMKPYQEYAC